MAKHIRPQGAAEQVSGATDAKIEPEGLEWERVTRAAWAINPDWSKRERQAIEDFILTARCYIADVDPDPTPEEEAEIGAALRPMVRDMSFKAVRTELADLIGDANAALQHTPAPTPENDNRLYYPLLLLVRALEQPGAPSPAERAGTPTPETGREAVLAASVDAQDLLATILRGEITGLNEALTQARSRIAELEKAAAERDDLLEDIAEVAEVLGGDTDGHTPASHAKVVVSSLRDEIDQLRASHALAVKEIRALREDKEHDTDVVGHARGAAEALWATAQAQKAKRAEQTPDEIAAVRVLTGAYYRLQELGWRESKYAPKDQPLDLIEAGSSGIHHGYRDEHGFWIVDDGTWESRAILYRLTPEKLAVSSPEKP